MKKNKMSEGGKQACKPWRENRRHIERTAKSLSHTLREKEEESSKKRRVREFSDFEFGGFAKRTEKYFHVLGVKGEENLQVRNLIRIKRAKRGIERLNNPKTFFAGREGF